MNNVSQLTRLYALLIPLLCTPGTILTGDKTKQQEPPIQEVQWRKVGKLYCVKPSSTSIIVKFVNLHAPADPNEEVKLNTVSCNNRQHGDCINCTLFVQAKHGD